MRKLLFWTHLMIGVVFGILILVKAVTGVMLAYEHQIVEWMEKDVRTISTNRASNIKLNLNRVISHAQDVYPKATLSGVTCYSDPNKSVIVNFRKGGGVFVDPNSGTVLGVDSKTHKFMHGVDEIHRWYGFKPVGRPLSGAATMGFFLLALSGLYLWWPTSWTTSKLKSVTLFNRRLTGKARDWNWHNVIGFWLAPLLVVITLTGIVMSYTWANNMLYRFMGTPPQQSPNSMPQPERGQKEVKVDFDVLFEKAQQQIPSWISMSFRFPQKPNGHVNVTILERDVSWGIPIRSQLSLNLSTSEIATWEPFSQISAGRRARIWTRYLHTGEAGGWVGQGLMLFASLGSILLVWTGLALTWRRYSQWREKKSQKII